MNAAALTMILLAGTSAYPTDGRTTTQSMTMQGATSGGQCANCECEEEKHGCCECLCGKNHNDGSGLLSGFRDMPQSCYNPAYGCYPGNDRRINRYPAFYGSYYRKPYNYRNLFDYPWHAGLHEPTSLFSYNVINPEEQDRNTPPGGRTTVSKPGQTVEHHTN